MAKQRKILPLVRLVKNKHYPGEIYNIQGPKCPWPRCGGGLYSNGVTVGCYKCSWICPGCPMTGGKYHEHIVSEKEIEDRKKLEIERNRKDERLAIRKETRRFFELMGDPWG